LLTSEEVNVFDVNEISNTTLSSSKCEYVRGFVSLPHQKPLNPYHESEIKFEEDTQYKNQRWREFTAIVSQTIKGMKYNRNNHVEAVKDSYKDDVEGFNKWYEKQKREWSLEDKKLHHMIMMYKGKRVVDFDEEIGDVEYEDFVENVSETSINELVRSQEENLIKYGLGRRNEKGEVERIISGDEV
jgi:hypothetical protein